jgi:deoxyribodipyrimidine photo-lyase
LRGLDPRAPDVHLHWHRRDLRAVDNCGLDAGSPDESVLPVFVFDDAVLSHAAPPRVRFVLDALADLRRTYRDLGGDLIVRRGDPSAVLPAVADRYGADRVTWCRDYSGLARERDDAVRAALDASGGRGDARSVGTLTVDAVHDAVHHPPGDITTSDGDHYSVFTYYGRKWADREKRAPVDPPAPDRLPTPGDDATEPIPDLAALGFDEPEADVPEGTRSAGRRRLREFCGASGPGDADAEATGEGHVAAEATGACRSESAGRPAVFDYAGDREVPAMDGTSRLSPHLKFGTLGVREVYDATRAAMARTPDDAAREGVEEFREQLAWREFYAQVLAANPETVVENHRDFSEPIEWRTDPEAIAAWKAGRTGYPIVDAGMRQLLAEAWMHNRVRMIVASFLTKDLLLDWREGYAWFRERLVDHDTANDVGGWQWAASTGTDAQPYFRIFNPTTQGERHDPDATYVRRYVPELEGVPAELIHDWPDLDEGQRRARAPDYPAPIVDHATRREDALDMFERARGE